MENVQSARTRNARAASVLALVCPFALALDPSLDLSQYAHTPWTIREGFLKSTVHAIAQTRDGYLWLGTESGLVRFDGVHFVPWNPPAGSVLPSPDISRLLVARDGTLWIGTYSGLASWNGTKLIGYRELEQQIVASIAEDGDGTVWAGTYAVPAGRLCAIRNSSTQCYGQDGSFGRIVLSLFVDGDKLWAGAESGLWRWRPGPPQFYAMPHSTPGLEIQDLDTADEGRLLLATNNGLKTLPDGRVQQYAISGLPKVRRTHRLLRDRDGGLWIGTGDQGILHVHRGRTDIFSKREGLSGDDIYSLFEDREGNVWAATNRGIDRFRAFAASTLSSSQGLSTDSVWSVVAARDGSVWIGSQNGLNRWDHGTVTIFRKNGLADDNPQSLFEDAGRIWLFGHHGLGYLKDGAFVGTPGVPGKQVHAITGDGAGGLWLSEDKNLLHVSAGRVVEQIPWSQLGSDGVAPAVVPGREPGALWLGFRTGRGVIYLKDGQIRQSYRAADGLGEGAASGLKLDPDGALWAATAGGLSLIRNGRVATMTSKNGLPCDNVHWVVDDDSRSTWLYLGCGLARIDRKEIDAWKADSKRMVHPLVFDNSDGVMLHSDTISGFSPRVAKSPDGRLWFVTGAGIQIVDPSHLPFNPLAPPVHIENIVADRDVMSNRRLPALTHDLEIDYTALSLTAPEKNRFKYKLEGYDRDWINAGNRRQAFYTNLGPRNYRFRVMASNNSGVWNEAGDSIEFSIAPAYYQTAWFRVLIAALVLGAAWGLYRLRLHQLAREFNVRMDERVSERTRLARDLHDTLLQSFHGLMLRFQVVDNLLPEGKAKQELEKVLDQADRAIAEGRSAVYDLRSSTTTTNDLAEAISAVAKEFAGHNGAAFNLTIEGVTRDLHPIIRDEIYRISREALINAFKHAHASHIEAEISYGAQRFRMRIRDDGQGIPPEILDQGREGHFGLPGMRERAKQIGAELNIWSRPASGTEIELTLAGSTAYRESPPYLESA
jgi:signal transduction histidine kinase/ligand-binding sensor domain-containing protein